MAGHTEKEAAELWCPHFRGNLAKVADVAMIDGNQDGRCIGSRCSQWRWNDGSLRSEERRGFCGLAGRP